MDNQIVTSTVTRKSTISVTSMDNPWSGRGGIMGRIYYNETVFVLQTSRTPVPTSRTRVQTSRTRVQKLRTRVQRWKTRMQTWKTRVLRSKTRVQTWRTRVQMWRTRDQRSRTRAQTHVPEPLRRAGELIIDTWACRVSRRVSRTYPGGLWSQRASLSQTVRPTEPTNNAALGTNCYIVFLFCLNCLICF